MKKEATAKVVRLAGKERSKIDLRCRPENDDTFIMIPGH
jgi:hypothetical protein